MRKLISNKTKCFICNQILESKSMHDFKTCRCGNLSVDGGLDYIRRGFENKDSYVEMSKYKFIDTVQIKDE